MRVSEGEFDVPVVGQVPRVYETALAADASRSRLIEFFRCCSSFEVDSASGVPDMDGDLPAMLDANMLMAFDSRLDDGIWKQRRRPRLPSGSRRRRRRSSSS